MSRPSHPKRFTDDQLRLHKDLGHQLQRANALAAQWLIILDRLNPAHKDFEGVCSELVNVANSMDLLSAYCERIVASGCRQPYSRINVIVGKVCERCLPDEERRRNTARQDDGRLQPDPAWKLQVEILFSITILVVPSILARCSFSTGKTQKYARCLHDLGKALGRQQRHLNGIGSPLTPKIRTIYGFDRKVCPKCGTPYALGHGLVASGQELSNSAQETGVHRWGAE